jgi:hypothetical protein
MDKQLGSMMILAVDRVVAQEDEELGVYSFNIGGFQSGAEWLISIQLPLNISEQDISLGQDIYAITPSTGATHYGEVLDGGLSLDQIPSDQDKPLTDDLVRLVDEFMNSSAAAAARHPGPTARPDPR